MAALCPLPPRGSRIKPNKKPGLKINVLQGRPSKTTRIAPPHRKPVLNKLSHRGNSFPPTLALAIFAPDV